MDGYWKPAERAVIIYVRSGKKLLLIHKKTGLGKGKINAPGGRIEKGETPVQAAVRECIEETEIVPVEPVLRGVLDFSFDNGYSLCGYVFTADAFMGTEVQTPEADPFWCPLDKIPYEKMWADDALWLPCVLENKCILGQFRFHDDIMKSHKVQILDGEKKILCYGSSSTWGYDWQGGGRLDENTRWPCVIKKYIPECFKIKENGICGRTVLDHMAVKSPTNGFQSLERTSNLNIYSGIFIFLGNNDFMADPEISVSKVAEGVARMVELIRQRNKMCRIFLVSPVPISRNCDEDALFASFFESQVNKSNKFPSELKKVAEKYGCTFIEAGKFATCDGTDGIHFSSEANRALALHFGDFINCEDWNTADEKER